MSREAQERKTRILDAAERLFATRGYEETSTSDIQREVGIARGTLYYHFKSKEDILDATIERITKRLVSKAAAIATNTSMPVLERLTQTMLALNVSEPSTLQLLEQAHKPQNALMHRKMQEQMLAQVTPVLVRLIEEGISQGICSTKYPEQTAYMCLLYTSTAFDALEQITPQEQQTRIVGFIYNLERLLGMAEGSLQMVILPIFRKD